MFGANMKTRMPAPDEAPAGRSASMPVADRHFVHHNPLKPPFPDGIELAMFGMGCFWGAEKHFWVVQGVYSTAVGYAGGYTANPTYQEVCTGRTGHNEVVRVAYAPERVGYQALLKIFWEAHDPTQGMRQGNDIGTQYRSGIYYFTDAQQALAAQTGNEYQQALLSAGHARLTTEVLPAPDFYYAEDYHQQYLAKNPAGYCGASGTGVPCTIRSD